MFPKLQVPLKDKAHDHSNDNDLKREDSCYILFCLLSSFRLNFLIKLIVLKLIRNTNYHRPTWS